MEMVNFMANNLAFSHSHCIDWPATFLRVPRVPMTRDQRMNRIKATSIELSLLFRHHLTILPGLTLA